MRPIAMRCSQEQWEAIKSKLKKCEIYEINSFYEYNYLTNNFNGVLGVVGNISERSIKARNRTVYEEWDEEIFLEACDIKPVVNEFNKDDYIVTLKGDFSITNCAEENYCFKQKTNSSYIKPYIDLIGCSHNDNSNLTFDKYNWLQDWRYATPEEIAEYDRLGKPYDVTTLSKMNKKDYRIGSYVVFLEDNIQNNRYEKGDISKIVGNCNNPFIINCENGYSNNINSITISKIKNFITKEKAIEFSKQLLSENMQFQLPEKWACRLDVENRDRFEAAYNKLINKHYFYFTTDGYYYYNFRANRTETLEDCTEITLEQMEEAAGINACKGKDTVNVEIPLNGYDLPQSKQYMNVKICPEQLSDKELINLTKPTLNRPKRKQLNLNLIKPIKPVKL